MIHCTTCGKDYEGDYCLSCDDSTFVSDGVDWKKAFGKMAVTAAKVAKKLNKLRTLVKDMEKALVQCKTDLEDIPREIYGNKTAEWDEWSSPANTIRWIDKLLKRPELTWEEANEPTMETDKPC